MHGSTEHMLGRKREAARPSDTSRLCRWPMSCATCTDEALAFDDFAVTSNSLPIRSRWRVALRELLECACSRHMSNNSQGYLFDRRHSMRHLQYEWGMSPERDSVTTCVRRFGRESSQPHERPYSSMASFLCPSGFSSLACLGGRRTGPPETPYVLKKTFCA